mmetsp:Transcript_4435/g.13354  ORF Transcript_4435/g.13354 Transcript_4435/m.13354 type:complete len:223 (-) Transcript_4435:150-818(-)
MSRQDGTTGGCMCTNGGDHRSSVVDDSIVRHAGGGRHLRRRHRARLRVGRARHGVAAVGRGLGARARVRVIFFVDRRVRERPIQEVRDLFRVRVQGAVRARDHPFQPAGLLRARAVGRFGEEARARHGLRSTRVRATRRGEARDGAAAGRRRCRGGPVACASFYTCGSRASIDSGRKRARTLMCSIEGVGDASKRGFESCGKTPTLNELPLIYFRMFVAWAV